MLCHAIGAAEVAAIRDRDTQISDCAAERIDHRSRRAVEGSGVRLVYGGSVQVMSPCVLNVVAKKGRVKAQTVANCFKYLETCPLTISARSILLYLGGDEYGAKR